MPSLLRISPGGQASLFTGTHAPSRRILPGGQGLGRIGTQAPPNSRNSPGGQGRALVLQDMPSALTKRLLQQAPSGILV
jgi:hypothetical protein